MDRAPRTKWPQEVDESPPPGSGRAPSQKSRDSSFDSPRASDRFARASKGLVRVVLDRTLEPADGTGKMDEKARNGERRGVWALLELPSVYRALQWTLGAHRWRRALVLDHAKPEDG